ncbi:hypothetical protein V8G54_026237 [Vigna mungo]|uniref:cytokinin riboside 5'-monophosphate phosphoribohydrolase n=1 Tax=Vigna mungo TaxID=3915 RepID=A0AAQ3RPB3_VIGMU
MMGVRGVKFLLVFEMFLSNRTLTDCPNFLLKEWLGANCTCLLFAYPLEQCYIGVSQARVYTINLSSILFSVGHRTCSLCVRKREMEKETEMKQSKFKRICVFCGSSPGNKTTYKDAAIELGRELVQKTRAILFTHILVLFGTEKVSRNIDLVYGGGSIGLMGLISQAVYEGGRHVIGVIPKTLMPREILMAFVVLLAYHLNWYHRETKGWSYDFQLSPLLCQHCNSHHCTAPLLQLPHIPWHALFLVLTGETVGEVKAVADMHQRKAEMAKRSDAFIALPGGYGTLEELLEVITWAQLGIHDKPVGLLNVDGYYNTFLSFIDKAVEEGFISPTARHIIVSAPTPKELVKEMEEYFPQHERVVSKVSWEREQLH